jgi:hypothetical protein
MSGQNVGPMPSRNCLAASPGGATARGFSATRYGVQSFGRRLGALAPGVGRADWRHYSAAPWRYEGFSYFLKICENAARAAEKIRHPRADSFGFEKLMATGES